ncbi:MAG: cell division protein FtsQ/DivIB [Acetobacteraceae bacterium]
MSRAPRNSVQDRPSAWTLIWRRARRYSRLAGWVAFTATVVVFVLVLARSAAPGGSIVTLRERVGDMAAGFGLRVADIVIEGRANTPEPLLRAAIGISKGDPILGFSVEEARKRIEELSWVEHATVERRLPDTVIVVLQERRPFAIWQNQGKFLLIDRAGQVVTNRDVVDFKHLPLVVGVGAPLAAAALLDALTDRPALAARVEAAVRVGGRRWNLHLKNGADVMLPEGHERVAIDRLMQLHETQAILDRPLLAIDMRLGDRLVVRPRPDARIDVQPTSGTQPGSPSPAGSVAAKKPT